MSTSSREPPPTNPASPRPTLSPLWTTFHDATFGFSLSYPASWTEVRAVSTPGLDFFASRPGVTSGRDLSVGDYWLAARRFAPDATIGCGAPVDGFSKLAAYSGRPWGVYSRRDIPSISWSAADAFSVFDDWCYAIDLLAGPRSDPVTTLNRLDAIGQTFSFNAEPAASPMAPPVSQRHLVATPDHSAPNGHVVITGPVLAAAPILVDGLPRCASFINAPQLSPNTGDLSLEVTMGSALSGAPCPQGQVQVIVWVGYLAYDALVVVDA